MQRVARLSAHLASAESTGMEASELFSVQGKVALVTGGSRGIGLMIAQGLVSNGCKVYICSRKEKACEEAANELNKAAEKCVNGGLAVSLPGDLSSIEGVIALSTKLERLEPQLDILVNNAGATWGAPLEEYPDKAWEKVMDLNVRHLFNLTQKLLPLLKKAGRVGDPSRVINIASTDGVRAVQTFGPTAAFAYTTSKGAVVHLSKALCRALAPYNITVNCVCPGLFPSNMTKFVLSSEQGRDMASKSNPLKRYGRDTDMAGTLLYLCSPAGAFTNGSIIVVDGGQYLHNDNMIPTLSD